MYHYASNNPVRYIDQDGKFDTLKEYNNLSDEDDNSPNYGAAIACYFLGSLICLGTFAEDFATVGIGVADDPESLAVAGMLFAYGRMLTRGDIPVYSKATNKSNRNIGVLQNSLFGGGNNACASPSPMPQGDDDHPHFKNSKETAKDFNTDSKSFERNIKQDIIKDARDISKNNMNLRNFLKENNNPDIGIDSKGNIWFKSRISGNTIKTGLQIEMYID